MSKGNVIQKMKDAIRRSGSNKGKFIYFRPSEKVRVRFLEDMDKGKVIPFHDSFTLGINVPCQELLGRECPYCGDAELRHRDQYCWSVYDYEAKEVKVMMGAISSASPVPALVGLYDAYGTIVDRDYVITKNGKGTSSSFSVVPMDVVKFRNEKAKPFSESKLMELLDLAFPSEGSEEVEEPKTKSKKTKKKPVEVEVEVEDDDDDDDASEYEDMSAKELYKLCVERDIDCKKKEDAEYYIEKLIEDDNSEEDDDDDDDW